MQSSKGLRLDPIAEARRQWKAHGWQEAADGMAVVTSIIRVEQLLLGRIDSVLRPMGLTFARYEVLVLLDFSRKGELPLGKIGSRLQVHPTSVTNAVDRLEADKLVRRIAHPEDRRATLAALTPQGRRLARTATTELNEKVFAALSWSGDDHQTLFDLLREFRMEAGDFR